MRYLRAAVQLASFILIPGLFIKIFSAAGSLVTAAVSGSFVYGEQAENIVLLIAVFAVTFIWGRFFCGFICSFGAMQDLLWLGGKRLPFRPVLSQKADAALKYLKYAVLLFILIGVWIFGLGNGTVWSPWTVFGMYSSPWKGLPAQAVWMSLGGLLLLVTVIGSLLIERFFCRYLCPLGAMFAIVSRFRIFKLERRTERCSGKCRVCTRQCSMGIPLYRYEKIDSGECIDCMKCTSACAAGNMRAETVPAVSGTLAAMALAGLTLAGKLPVSQDVSSLLAEPAAAAAAAPAGRFTDGYYTGSAKGYRGTTEVSVEVTGGAITDIVLVDSGDDPEFIAQAMAKVIPAIISAQDTDVDTVSGATYSSAAIINAVADALGTQTASAAEAPAAVPSEAPRAQEKKKTQPAETEEPSVKEEDPDPEQEDVSAEDEDDEEEAGEAELPAESDAEDEEDYEEPAVSESGLQDGVYYGYGSGFRGTTEVEVTVEGGVITDITVLSYQDDYKYFVRAEDSVIWQILNYQSADVDAVSGATFSSNSIIEAVSDALGWYFDNPNSYMSRGHGR